MKIFLKTLLLLFATVILICGGSYLTDKNKFAEWKISSRTTGSTAIAWAPFTWGGDSLGNTYFERAAMFIPATIEGIPYHFQFQFDLGAYTVLYENNFASLFNSHPELKNRIGRLKSPLQFWNSQRSCKGLVLNFGDIIAATDNCRILKNYGQPVNPKGKTDTAVYQLGTIGIDLFRNKILIIDYPNERFGICDKLPAEFTTKLVDIEIDEMGRAILPMKIRANSYRILFDNGSSVFPIITMAKNISNFSSGPDTDTLQLSSWGQQHKVTGRMIEDSFELGGQSFSHVKAYANHSGLGIDGHTDGMTGNALFWNRTLVLDLKNRKFGIK